ncbi:unnamed protein product [Lathyrus sativus]|nr:unnamed protein product [Lathyrus sativus]
MISLLHNDLNSRNCNHQSNLRTLACIFSPFNSGTILDTLIGVNSFLLVLLWLYCYNYDKMLLKKLITTYYQFSVEGLTQIDHNL